MSDAMTPRVFLFLQGPSSSIFMKIATRLEQLGHRCLRINLNAGDQIFWRGKGATHYRGRGGDDWSRFVTTFIRDNRVTDLVLLGEERDYHRIAVEAARHAGVSIYVVEMGYLRPDWLTLERDGMSSNSHFPADPQQILDAAQTLPEPDWKRRYSQTFVADAGLDLLYNLPNVFLWFLYPHFRRHALFHPLAEYAGWIVRLLRAGSRSRQAEAVIEETVAGAAPFFVFPLQLQTDFQLRAHSPYNDQREAIDTVIGSFAHAAPADARLIVKVHPLDNGLIDWRSYVDRRAGDAGVATRLDYVDGGNLDHLLDHAAGTVTVNSTVGLHALQRCKPVKVLGSAVFDVDGLTHQGPLDGFWTAPHQPDPALAQSFFRLMAAAIQVRGNFYSKAGTDAGAAAIAQRLHELTVNEPGGFIDPPPRARPEKLIAASRYPIRRKDTADGR